MTQPADKDDELKPCPCCGGKASIGNSEPDGSGGYFVECGDCGVTTPLIHNMMGTVRRELLDKWNRRVVQPELQPSKPVAWIVFKGATTLHFAEADGWNVQAVAHDHSIVGTVPAEESDAEFAQQVRDMDKPLSASLPSSEPDGYAVLLDDKASSPKGYWFVGCYISKEAAADVVMKGKQGGMVVPIYFEAPRSTSGPLRDANGTWTEWIRFDSDCIVNGVEVKAGTSWGPFEKSKTVSATQERK